MTHLCASGDDHREAAAVGSTLGSLRRWPTGAGRTARVTPKLSDIDLRTLERRFRDSGRVEDEAAWLRSRRRVKQLPDERLWLAAYVGHPAAVRVFYEDRPEQVWLPQTPQQVDCWVRGLEQWGQTTLVRAAVSVAWSLLAIHADEPAFRIALQRAELWILEPSFDHARRANSATPSAGETALAAFDRFEEGREPTREDPGAMVFCVGGLVTAATSVAHWCAGRHAAWIESWPGDAVELGDQFEKNRPAARVGKAVSRAARMGELAAVVEALQRELASFALSYADPVRERVMAREREEP